jgi:hypothetical protein
MHLSKKLKSALAGLPKEWDAKSCMMEMKKNGCKNWKQNEWIGWYFQYLCETKLKSIFNMPGTKYGNVVFDGAAEGINFDFKAHSWYGKNRNIQSKTILNDIIAMEESIKENSTHGLLVALLDCSYDHTGEFKTWYEKIKGPASAYVKSGRISGRRQRMLKTNAKVIKYLVLTITAENIKKLQINKQGKNSNGKPRLPKYTINFSELSSFDPIEI